MRQIWEFFMDYIVCIAIIEYLLRAELASKVRIVFEMEPAGFN